jgi:hypothetical protein
MPETIDPNDIRIFSGRSHPALAAGIAEHLGVPLEKTHFSRFSNDNLFIQLCASVRGRVVFIVQSLVPPVSDHLLELLMMLDIARSAAASEVHAIIPYFSYARSDKKNAPRISITARLIAELLETEAPMKLVSTGQDAVSNRTVLRPDAILPEEVLWSEQAKLAVIVQAAPGAATRKTGGPAVLIKWNGSPAQPLISSGYRLQWGP